jgi:hypothetical protein
LALFQVTRRQGGTNSRRYPSNGYVPNPNPNPNPKTFLSEPHQANQAGLELSHAEQLSISKWTMPNHQQYFSSPGAVIRSIVKNII